MIAATTAPSGLRLPASAHSELARSRADRVDQHAVEIETRWWNDALEARGLAGGPILGSDPRLPLESRTVLTRGDLFEIARPVAQHQATDNDLLRLLWHTLAWGSGVSYRQNHKRMNAFVGSAGKKHVDLLREAAILSYNDPASAYRTLIRRGGGKIPGLGPSFFTKFLYFAGAGAIDHPCAILDALVTRALHENGWRDLTPGWSNWYTATYASYCDLLKRWAGEGSQRLQTGGQTGRVLGVDEIERWLFGVGKRAVDRSRHRSEVSVAGGTV